MKVVVVESPAKAKTINKYLGKGYDVYASFGHVRDLAAKDGSVDPDHDFAMRWEVDAKAAKRLAEIGGAVKDADALILATDPDREGEAISWHVYEILKAKSILKDKRVDRVVFNAVTKEAVQDAMRHPREIDEALVDAYRARRALDYLVGFNLSPVLWRKLPGARSAGRVQSVALRIVCDREVEIERVRSARILVDRRAFEDPGGRAVHGAAGRRRRQEDRPPRRRLWRGSRRFSAARSKRRNSRWSRSRRNPSSATPTRPSPPRRCSRKRRGNSALRRRAPCRSPSGSTKASTSAKARSASSLICAPTASTSRPRRSNAARKVIAKDFGDAYVPARAAKILRSRRRTPRRRTRRSARPTSRAIPRTWSRHLEPEQAKLYELIWTRTIACQMESAELERTTVEILAEAGARQLEFRATGQVVRFPGFLALYQEGRDDEEDEDGAKLPPMNAGEPLTKERIDATQHFTEPPPRYTEATLVKRMEELGIGRPSTYASTLAVLRDRDYVRLEKKRLIPEDKGRLVTAFLESFFARYVEYDFTAALEEKLDLRLQLGDRLEGRAGRFLARFLGGARAKSRICAPARCSTASTNCWARMFSRRARTAPTRASAPLAAKASCR